MLLKVLLSICVLFLFVARNAAFPQCPSMSNSGVPAVLFMNIFTEPYYMKFTDGQKENMPGLAMGFNLGAMPKKKFHIQTGAEFYWVKRTIHHDTLLFGDFDKYVTSLIEVPLEFRVMMYRSLDKTNHGYFVFGLGLMLANVKETTDQDITINEMLYHQTFLRMAYEHSITIRRSFNILWGLVGKADAGALAGSQVSYLNGSLYGGVKMGIQLGF